MDLIIKGGTVVAPEGASAMDVGIEGEKIVAVSTLGTLDFENAKVIDATGKIVLPGGIEPHTHINVPVPDYWAGGAKCLPSHLNLQVGQRRLVA